MPRSPVESSSDYGYAPAVIRITGISEKDLYQAVPECAAWQVLFTAAQRLAALNRSALCPTIIHFARSEQPFLRRMHESHALGRLTSEQLRNALSWI